LNVNKKNLARSANRNEKETCETLLSDNNITQSNTESQYFYSEFHEFESKFNPKKKKSILLAKSFMRIGEKNRAERVLHCGDYLEFAHEIYYDGVIAEKGKLHNANFCHERLCPMCIWRRTLKIYAQISKIMLNMPKDLHYLFLTLTVPNCEPDAFQDTLDRLFKSWAKFTKNKKFKNAVLGYYRVLEVTRNKRNGTYHPHFHIILAVIPSYFNGKHYIKHDEFLDMWRKAYGDERITQVDIRKIKARDKSLSETSDLADLDGFKTIEGAVSETAKYCVKDEDFIIENNKPLMDNVVKTLLFVLKGRRLVQFGGIFKDIAKQLKLDDAEDGDLVHLDEDKINGAVAQMIIRYGWRCGAYTIISQEIVKDGEIQ